MPETLLMVVLALGTGVSIGWVLHAFFIRVAPDPVSKLAKSIGEQFTVMKEEAKDEVARLTRAIADERAQWRGMVNWYQNFVESRLSSPGQLQKPQDPPKAEEPRASTNGHTDEARLRARLEPLIGAQTASEVAKKIVSGEVDDLGLDPAMSTVVDEIQREETGLT